MNEPMSQEEIFEAIANERDRQDTLWGQVFDDKNTANDWAAYMASYIPKTCEFKVDPWHRREALIKMAALAVAAIEAQDRVGLAPRHYDPKVK